MLTYLALMHARLPLTITLVLAGLVLWGLGGAVLGRRLARPYLAGLAIAELLLLAEALFGVVLLLAGPTPGRAGLHLLYGVLALLVLPLAFGYARNRAPRAAWGSYTMACLFLAGLVLRAQQTGG